MQPYDGSKTKSSLLIFVEYLSFILSTRAQVRSVHHLRHYYLAIRTARKVFLSSASLVEEVEVLMVMAWLLSRGAQVSPVLVPAAVYLAARSHPRYWPGTAQMLRPYTPLTPHSTTNANIQTKANPRLHRWINSRIETVNSSYLTSYQTSLKLYVLGTMFLVLFAMEWNGMEATLVSILD